MVLVATFTMPGSPWTRNDASCAVPLSMPARCAHDLVAVQIRRRISIGRSTANGGSRPRRPARLARNPKGGGKEGKGKKDKQGKGDSGKVGGPGKGPDNGGARQQPKAGACVDLARAAGAEADAPVKFPRDGAALGSWANG